MQTLTSLFHQRIGLPINQTITFENLADVLERTAQNIPFENLTIIKNKKVKLQRKT
jgi:N-hydroxyarylamine O-acetyltransferase